MNIATKLTIVLCAMMELLIVGCSGPGAPYAPPVAIPDPHPELTSIGATPRILQSGEEVALTATTQWVSRTTPAEHTIRWFVTPAEGYFTPPTGTSVRWTAPAVSAKTVFTLSCQVWSAVAKVSEKTVHVTVYSPAPTHSAGDPVFIDGQVQPVANWQDLLHRTASSGGRLVRMLDTASGPPAQPIPVRIAESASAYMALVNATCGDITESVSEVQLAVSTGEDVSEGILVKADLNAASGTFIDVQRIGSLSRVNLHRVSKVVMVLGPDFLLASSKMQQRALGNAIAIALMGAATNDSVPPFWSPITIAAGKWAYTHNPGETIPAP